MDLKDSRLVVTPIGGHGREPILRRGVRSMCDRGRPGKTVGTQLTVRTAMGGIGRGPRAIVFTRGTIAERLLCRHLGAVLAGEDRVCDGTEHEPCDQKKGEHAMQKSDLHLQLRRYRPSRILGRTLPPV